MLIGGTTTMMYRHSNISGFNQPKEARVAALIGPTGVLDQVPLYE